jgi:hypothetical protein
MKTKFSILLFVCVGMICAILTSCATGPTPQQLAAQTEARRQAQIAQEEAAKKQAEAEAAAKAALEAKIAKVHADEKAGDDAAQAGDQQGALTNYVAAFQEAPRPSELEQQTREKIARFAATLSVPPDPPEESVRYSVGANVKFKAQEYNSAVSEMQEAVKLAPWWADGYYNLGLMQEGAEKYSDAIDSLKLYLLAAPKSPEAKAVQAKIYELQAEKEEADKTKQLEGDWVVTEGGSHYRITIDGNKIMIKQQGGSMQGNPGWVGISEGIILHGLKRGYALDGTVSNPGVKWSHTSPAANYETPSEIVPFSGTIAQDGSSIELRFVTSNYTWRSETGVVSLDGKEDSTLKLTRP